ncbi:glycosyltransferase [Priestia flexa]|uniref:glycosyltransferase n=1 Tax=Priestia flexa TaxID=86664 RepID=UPI0010FBFAE9|nr:glycosyltransferase [Priestia flexa]QCS53924.1 glycosyltransferase [Priestia flexa]
MNNNCVILLTNYYPFYKGEEYLESEIHHLSRNFKHIYIVPTMVSSKMDQTRELPKNAIVLKVGIDHSIQGKVRMVFNQFKKVYRDKSKRQMISKDSKGKLKSLLYCYYFESRAMDVYSHLEKELKKQDFNQYHNITIYSYWLYITARVGIEIRKRFFKNRDLKTVSRAHRYDLYEADAPLKYLPQREYLLSNLDAIYPCSQDGVNALKQTYPKYKNKIEVERLGTISTNVFGKTTKEKLYIVSCSVMRKVKRLDSLVEVLCELEKRNIPFLWTHIGGGPEFSKIKKLAENKLNSNNYHLTGSLSNKDVLNWYKTNPSTVFVNLSSSEGVPVAIMEAMSMKLPVIATDVGGTREIVKSRKNGYLVNKEFQVSEVVQHLEQIYGGTKEEYSAMCEEAFELWNKYSNAEVLYSQFVAKLTKKSLCV